MDAFLYKAHAINYFIAMISFCGKNYLVFDFYVSYTVIRMLHF